MRYVRFTIICSFLLIMTVASADFVCLASPSFNCQAKLNDVERSICENSDLINLDNQLNEKYQTVKSSQNRTANKQLKYDQLTWLKKRNSSCSKPDNVACIKNMYKTRVKMLDEKIALFGQKRKKIKSNLLKKEYFEPQDYLELLDNFHLNKKTITDLLIKDNTYFSKTVLVYLLYSRELKEDKDYLNTSRLLKEAMETFDDLSTSRFEYKSVSKEEVLRLFRYVFEKCTIPCSVIAAYPKDSFYYFGCYWGGGRDNWPYLCGDYDSIFTIEPVKAFQTTIYELYGATCHRGSIESCKWKSRAVGNIIYSLRPETVDESDEAYIANVEKFLKHWSLQGIWNFNLYKDYMSGKNKAALSLTGHYRKKNINFPKGYETLAKNVISNLIKSTVYVSADDYQEEMIGNLLPHLKLNEAVLYKEPEDVDKIINLYTANELKISLLLTSSGFPTATKKLLDKGVDSNFCNYWGKSALMQAAQYSDIASAKLLLNKGANINARTFEPENSYFMALCLKAYYRTAMMYAAWQGNEETILFFMKNAQANTFNIADTNGHKWKDYLKINTTISKDAKDRILNRYKHIESKLK